MGSTGRGRNWRSTDDIASGHPDRSDHPVSGGGGISSDERAVGARSVLQNPAVAAALNAKPPNTPPLPACAAPDQRKVFRKVRLRYQLISLAVIWTLTLVLLALSTSRAERSITKELIPLAVLILFVAAAAGVTVLLQSCSTLIRQEPNHASSRNAAPAKRRYVE